MSGLLLTPREELLWLVALLDAEGCFALNDGKYPRIVVGMTDEDTIRLAHKRAGCGQVTGPYTPTNKDHKSVWRWKVSRRDHVIELCKVLLPYMSSRRAAVIQSLLAKEVKRDFEPIWVRLDRWER
jgi:hypothetical protein